MKPVSEAGGVCTVCGTTAVLVDGNCEIFSLSVTDWYVEAYMGEKNAVVGFAAEFHGNDTVYQALDDIGFRLNEGTEVWASTAAAAEWEDRPINADGTYYFRCGARTEQNDNAICVLLDFDGVVYASRPIQIVVSEKIGAYQTNDAHEAQVRDQIVGEWELEQPAS